jgi:hypothetical protein
MGHTTHVYIPGSGTSRLELVENYAHRTGVEYVYHRKYCVSLAPSTVCGTCIKNWSAHPDFDFRIPKYSPSTLTEWYNSPVPAHRARLFHHLLGHSVLVLEMLDAADIIPKTA